MEQIFGYVERITFSNPENGFTVAKIKQPRKQELTTIVGTMPPIAPGEQLRLSGEWKTNPIHGTQFSISSYSIESPSDVIGIQKYLGSGMVKGIGEVYSKRIVDKFGTKTLEVIDSEPHLLTTVEGLGKKRIDTIVNCWQEQKSIRSVMIFLQKHEISPIFAQKLYRFYGNETESILKDNPYIMIRNLRGIGFKTADKVAHKLGFPKDSTQRIDSAIEHTLLELADEGHTCFPLPDLIAKAEQLLQVAVGNRISFLQQEERVVVEDNMVWLRGLWFSEKGIARELKRIVSQNSRLREVNGDKAIEWAEEKLKISLANNQKMAIKSSLTDKVHIITGGPGTGKSTITKSIITITSTLSKKIVLAAPTGRAAKRMTEITGREAFTIHSLLQFDFSKNAFRRNKENPIECDLIIVDEASMIDTGLMYSLLKAIPDHARLLLVGDVCQLPSVGPGSVLKDIIESKSIPVTELTEIFRQSAGSRIITNAHKINNGIFPDLSFEKESDFIFVKEEDPQKAIDKAVTLVTTRLPRFYKLKPLEDIQVISPMKRGLIGIDNLNKVFQKELNGKMVQQNRGVSFRGNLFCVRDKVMQIRNNYKKEVYNGDIGYVVKVDNSTQELAVIFDKKVVNYSFCDLDELVLAYATSVHKYQGSEAPCVVIFVHTMHFIMLHRNLLYTAITRGKRLVVLVGTSQAIAMSISRNDIMKRNTGLTKFIVD